MAHSLMLREGDWSGEIRLSPWPHLVVDGFLEASALEKSIVEIGDNASYEVEKRGDGQIEYSLLMSATLWHEIYSRRTIRMLSAVFENPLELSRDNWIQLRRMNSDSPEFPLHHDSVSAEDSVVSFLYLSAGWVQKCGGRLQLFKSLEDEIPVSSVEPIQNRFVAFQTKAYHWHAVEKVSGWERVCALALWNNVAS